MNEDLLQRTLAELNDRYTGLPDDYRHWLRRTDTETLQLIYNLAVDDAPSSKITELLGYEGPNTVIPLSTHGMPRKARDPAQNQSDLSVG